MTLSVLERVASANNILCKLLNNLYPQSYQQLSYIVPPGSWHIMAQPLHVGVCCSSPSDRACLTVGKTWSAVPGVRVRLVMTALVSFWCANGLDQLNDINSLP